ncbi:hypothetical protein GIW70_10995 [Pseudomonas syringae]|nr:hypothetical protein [Pseudomonas syringae]MCF5068725.1 hypothetical protein [Pseudomonas syringae]
MSAQWKLVPVEPTETMVINGFESEPNECFTDEEVWEQYQEMSGCQQAAFRAKLCWAAMLGSAPAAPEDSQPVMKLEAEKLWDGHGEYAVSFVRAGWLDERRTTGGEFLLYTHPATDEVARFTAERDALQLRLNAADQRIDDLCGSQADRSPHDYAVEHAEYMAKSADDVLAKFQAYGLALLAVDEGGDDGEDELFEAIDSARNDLQESLVDLRSMVYEFRKRSSRIPSL